MDRILLHVANAITLLCCLIAMILLPLAAIDLINGKLLAEEWLALIALAIVPYCFAGTLHRIAGTPGKG